MPLHFDRSFYQKKLEQKINFVAVKRVTSIVIISTNTDWSDWSFDLRFYGVCFKCVCVWECSVMGDVWFVMGDRCSGWWPGRGISANFHNSLQPVSMFILSDGTPNTNTLSSTISTHQLINSSTHHLINSQLSGPQLVTFNAIISNLPSM